MESKDLSSTENFQQTYVMMESTQSIIKKDRHAGVIYAARFFVTRVGFLRSIKRLITLSDTNLNVIDPYTDEIKETYSYQDIKEISVTSDGGDRGFSIIVGKTRESYTCRNRSEFLSAYYQLRERASAAESIAAAGGDLNSTSGLYFDNLFQLCGKTFHVEKLSTTQSTAMQPKRIPIVLAIRAASIDRIDEQTQQTISSTPLLEIVKIQKLKNDPTGLIIYYDNNRIHRYWCKQREPLIQAVGNNIRSWLYNSLQVEEAEDSFEFDALMSTRDIPLPVSFEIPVLKISKSSQTSNSIERYIGLTQSSIIERDRRSRRTLCNHSISDLYNIVIYPSESGKFALEMKNGRRRIFQCVDCNLNKRTKEIGVGFQSVTREEFSSELQVLLTNSHHEGFASSINELKSSNFSMSGSTKFYTASQARNVLICNLMELCRMNNVPIAWSCVETPIACKEGTWSTNSHPEYEEILLRKLSILNTTKTETEMKKILLEFNVNIPMNGSKQRDRKALSSLMKLIENEPNISYSPEFYVLCLLALYRIVVSRTVFEDIHHSQFKKPIGVILSLLHSSNINVGFAAALALRSMIISSSEMKNHKAENNNRRAVFTSSNEYSFVSRLFSTRRKSQRCLQDDKDVDFAKEMKLSLSKNSEVDDTLVHSCLLQTLESCLSSGKKGTPEKIFADLLSNMKIDSKENRHILFDLCHSPCFSITKCASVLTKVHILEQTAEIVEIIQDAARGEGLLIWQLYLSLSSHEKTQRRISSQLVALLTHENPRSSAVIRRIFPSALIGDIPSHALTCNEHGVVIYGGDKGYSSGSPRRRDRSLSVSLTGSGRGSRSRVVRHTKCVVLLPEFFERLNKHFCQKDLIWGPPAVEELSSRLIVEIAYLEIERLRHQFVLNLNPVRQFLLESRRQLRLEQERLLEEEEERNKSVGIIPASQDPMLGEDTTEKLEKNKDKTVEDVTGNNDKASNALSEKDSPVMGLKGMRIDERDLDMEKRQIVWNDEEFEMVYSCYEDEVKVGTYYLGNILDDRGNLCEEIDNAEEFILLLYYRLLNETSNQGIQLLCLKVMIQVYEQQKQQLSSLIFLNHLLQVVRKDRSGKATEWPLIVRGNVMKFVEHVLGNPANVRRFIEGGNLEIIMDLLEEIHPLIQAEMREPEGSLKQEVDEEEDVEDEDDESSSEKDSNDDNEEVEEEEEVHEDTSGEDGEEEDDLVDGKYVNLQEATGEKSHCHEGVVVVVEKSANMTSSSIALTCLGILTRLIQCHSSEDALGNTMTPLPSIRRLLCQESNLFRIVRMLGWNHMGIFRKTLYIMRILLHRNDQIASEMYGTGIFYYLFRYGTEKEMESIAHLLEDLHLSRSVVSTLVDVKTSSCNTTASTTTSLLMMDPLTKLCFQSVLSHLLPVSLIAFLLRHGPSTFAKAFFDDLNTPEVIWNHSMRSLLISSITTFMNMHTGVDGFECPSNQDTFPVIKYPKEVNGIQCYQYYLQNLLDEDRFPNWTITNEDAFLMALMKSLRDWIYPPKGWKPYETHEILLISRTITLLFRRFSNQSLSFQNFQGFKILFQALEKAMNQLDCYEDLFHQLMKIVSLTVSISSFNAVACSTGQGIRLIVGSLKKTEERVLEIKDDKKSFQKWKQTQRFTLQALTYVLKERNGRAAAATLSQSMELVPLLTPYLSCLSSTLELCDMKDESEIQCLTMGCLQALCASEGISVVLIQQIAENGIIWYLILLILDYQPVEEESDSSLAKLNLKDILQLKNQSALQAAETLWHLLQIHIKEDVHIQKLIKDMIQTIHRSLTESIVSVLQHQGVEIFFQIWTNEVLKPDLMWTMSMRNELRHMAEYALAQKEYNLPGSFLYASQKQELTVEGVYIRFYNLDPSSGILKEPKTLFSGLLSSLAHDIGGIRQKPEILVGILLRLEPITEALRNMLCYVPGMDSELIRLDGVRTLGSLFETAFESTPIVQLRSLECLHILIFHSTLSLDTIASIVPLYASKWFGFLDGFAQSSNISTNSKPIQYELALISLQVLSNLCLIPSCIDSLVKGMDASALARLLPFLYEIEPCHFQLLLAMYVTPLRRHTSSTIAFAKSAVRSQLVHSLLNVLSKPVPSNQMNQSRLTKEHTARLLAVLAANPGSGSTVASILNASKIWDAYSDVSSGSPDDVRCLLEVPYAPAMTG